MSLLRRTEEECARLKEEVRLYFKKLTIDQFVTFKQAAKKFHVDDGKIQEWVRDIARIGNNGIYKEKEVIYVSIGGLMNLLMYCSDWLYFRISSANPRLPYVLMYNKTAGQKYLQVCRFYKLNDIFKIFPEYKVRYHLIKRLKLAHKKNLLEKIPADLDPNHYEVLVAMLIFRIHFDKWPSYEDVSRMINGRLGAAGIKEIVTKNLISRYLIYRPSNKGISHYRAFIVRYGPKELVMKKITICISDFATVRKINTWVPRDFATPDCAYF